MGPEHAAMEGLDVKRTGFKPRVSKLLTNADSQRASARVSTDKQAPLYRLTRPVNFEAQAERFTPTPKEPERIEHEGYRRLVAQLPCVRCHIEGWSQCAHPNSNKTKGRKADDRECFPLCCDRPGVNGCHPLFDQYKLGPRDWSATFEELWGEWTRAMIDGLDLWPKNLPRWPG